MLWKDYPIAEAQWIPADNFLRAVDLQNYIRKITPKKSKNSNEEIAIEWGSSC